MTIWLYDPSPHINDYLSPMYFRPMELYANSNRINVRRVESLQGLPKGTVVCNADYLTPGVVADIKNSGGKIVGFSITDSSWVSQVCREGPLLDPIDLMFMLTGVQTVNHGHEMVLDSEMNITLESRRFLPDSDWAVFNAKRLSGRLQSLPYVHAERQPDVPFRDYLTRSQKVLIRGGHHMRRFILALQLQRQGLLDINSGFCTSAYFQDSMNPQFRYCDQCRHDYKQMGQAWHFNPKECLNPCWPKHTEKPNVSELRQWNNRCPCSFINLAHQYLRVSNEAATHLMNARWLPAADHLAMLARISFTSDLKWLFSIYAAQRFWDAAMVGCINFLPSRTADQEYFPAMEPGVHYKVFDERLKNLPAEIQMDEIEYLSISANAFAMYQQWMRPTEYSINTQLIQHIFSKIEEHTS